MVKVRWSQSPTQFQVSVRNLTERMEKEVTGIVEDATKAGAEAMQEAIEQDTQTDWVGRGPFAGQGRQDSGDFRKHIESDVKEYAVSAKGEYGWINKRADYYLYQEHGFRHWISTNWIPGVRALYHGAERAKAVMFERISDVFGVSK